MPSHFDRFRLLNADKGKPGAIRFRNEGPEPVYVRATEQDPQQVVPPGQEVALLPSETGEVLIEADPTS